MSEKNYKANCGCEIHIVKWNYKTEVASVKHCPLHKAAGDLLEACKAIFDSFQHFHTSDEPKITAFQKLTEAIVKAEGRP